MDELEPQYVLSKHLACGMAFHSTPVEMRELAAISPEKLATALQYLREQPGVRECMILSTCNRTELYASAEEWVDGRELFLRFVRATRGADLSPAGDQIYCHRGKAAIEHLFRVASSLDSQIMGEPQILGQARAAFRAAENAGCVDRDLHRWVSQAFAVAKRIRSQTGIGGAAVSISYAAVQLAKKIFEDLSQKKVVLAGAGRMSELAALHFREFGASSIVVTNRTFSRAEELARRCGGLAVEFEQRGQTMEDADIVICSTDAPHFIIDRPTVDDILKRRPHRPLLLLDMSMPRNIDPAVAELEGAYLFNLDDLESIVQSNREARRAEARRAEAILKNAQEKFLREEARSQMGPAIAAVRNQVRSICEAELVRLQQKIPDLSPQHREELELMLHRIAQKIVHPAIMELKAANDQESARERKGLVERIFGIENESIPC